MTMEGQPPNATEGSDMPYEHRTLPFDSVAAVDRRRRRAGFSKTARKLLAKAVRGNTAMIYRGRFAVFSSWCVERGENPCTAPLHVIVNFLAALFRKIPKLLLLYDSCVIIT
jgi:hypothetical protein